MERLLEELEEVLKNTPADWITAEACGMWLCHDLGWVAEFGWAVAHLGWVIYIYGQGPVTTLRVFPVQLLPQQLV